MATYSGHEGALFVSAGTPQALTNAPTTADTARERYRITDPSKRFITRTATVTVETSPDGSVWTPATEGTDYTLTRIGGIVEFTLAQDVGTQVRISGTYIPVVELANVTGWSFEVSRDVHAHIVMRQEYRVKAYGAGDTKGSFERLWFDEEMFDNLSGMADLIMVLYVNYDEGLAYGVYSKVASLKVDSAGDGVVQENVDFEGDGTPYYIYPLG